MLLILACATTAPPEKLLWRETCGDPACGGHVDQGLVACSTEVAGEECPKEGEECDLQNDCNSTLRCDTHALDSMCPISMRSYKRDIQYLSQEERARVALMLLDTKLATWEYKDQLDHTRHFGFIIEDNPGSYAVAENGKHVDMYGYVSMLVAVVQEQQGELQRQRAELEALKQELKAMKGQ
jgi:hypothetical protein